MMRRFAVVCLVALLVLSLAPAAGAAKRKIPTLVGPLRLIPNRAETLRAEGLHDYFGTLEVRSSGSGLVLVNRLGLERYLLGLNEVPTRWPVEALRAQAIAARTYALYTLGRPRAGSAATYGFDICASVACQVFSGADVIQESLTGDRWAAAVADTKGQAVLYDGAPILARYHSTSGGQTFDNEQIFPSEGPFPYLKGVVSTTEQASPLYRWYVDFKLKQMQRILRLAGLLPGDVGRLLDVRTVPSRAGSHYPDVILRARRSSHRFTAEEIRRVVRTLAPELYPGSYPSFAPTSSGRLPEVFPSNRLEMTTEGRTVEVVGRGWGHGVGMSQFGAEGMARAGATAEEILNHYYTGVEVGSVDTGGPIEVGVAWGLPSLRVTGDARIVDGKGRTVVRNALGTWRLQPAGAGAVAVRPPEGFGLPLEVGIVRAPEEVEPGERARLVIALSRPARVAVGTDGPATGPGELRSAGRKKVTWRAPAEPGDYEVRVAARAGSKKRADRVMIAVVEPVAAPAPRAGPLQDEGDGPPWPVLGLVIVLLGAAAFVVKKVTMER